MLDSYHTSFSAIAKDKGTLLCLLLLSLIYRIALCSMPYFVLKMFGAPVCFLHIFASTIYIYATICLVPTPGNAGAAEGAFYLVFPPWDRKAYSGPCSSGGFSAIIPLSSSAARSTV